MSGTRREGDDVDAVGGEARPESSAGIGERLRARLETEGPALVGRVTAVRAGRVVARVPDGQIGRCFRIERVGREPVVAQLVAFDGDDAFLLPFSALDGVEPRATVAPTEVGARAPRAAQVLGDVIDPLGVSLRDGRVYAADGPPLDAPPPPPLSRAPIADRLVTGVRVVDGLLPLGVGQRVGLFAGSGVGKSTLLGQLARSTSADVCVVALIGERGREVAEFVADSLDGPALQRTTVVVATSDAPPLMRVRAAEMATALAEQWRAAGKHCLLLVDSITRYARALRESALLGGESAARRGYPASVFAVLPRLLERSGCGEKGAITAVYTVLVEGGDMEEPVADEIRGIVDGHWVLTRRLAERGRHPAVDVPASVSRVADRVVDRDELESAANVRAALALLEQFGDAVDLGIYERGSRPALDAALDCRDELESFLRQRPDEVSPLADTVNRLHDLADRLDR